MTDDRVDWHLWNWAIHMRRGTSNHLKHRNAASSGIGRSGSEDFDQMVDSADKRCAEATGTAIDDLPKNDRCAVYATHLEQPCDLPPVAVAIYYRAACIEIGRKLDRVGIV